MEASVAPSAPVNPRSRLYVIGGIVVLILLIVAYSWYKNSRDARLIEALQSKDKATHVEAARTLMNENRFVDLILTEPPDVRDAAITAAKDSADSPDNAKKSIDALLGVSKGVDREINDPEQAVRDREGAVRKNAWLAMGAIGDVAIPQLLSALKDPSGNVRAGAIEALGYIGAPAIPGLMKMMTERETWDPAGAALSKIGQAALDPCLPLIDYSGTTKKARDLRLKMAGMLGGFDNQKAVPYLLRHIDDQDPGMRRQVIRTLAGLQDQRATKDVIRVMEEDPQVRLDAITALGEFHDPIAINPLADQFKNYDYDVPAGAVAALSKIGPAALPRMISDAKNPDPQIRTYATRALATIAGPMTIQPLLGAAKDPVADVRAEAVKGMGQFTGADAIHAVPLLIANFRDASATVSNAAVDSLTEIGSNPENASISSQVASPLVALFKKGGQSADIYNTQVFYSERVLSQIGGPALPQLLQALRGGTPEVQKWAALTLGDMKDREAADKSVEELKQIASNSPHPEAKWAAQDALNRMGGGSV
jgi:HEAT repeat protein